MKKAILTNLILFVFLSLIQSSNVFPWDNEVTHRDLSEYAAESSVLVENDYLKNLGFTGGLDEVFAWQGRSWTVIKWLREGANLEDSVSWYELVTNKGRFNNHFHNPLKQWWNAGLDDYVIIPNPIPPHGLYTHHVFGSSSVLWAQDSTYQESFREGDQSWQKIRENYYSALTGRDFKGQNVALTKDKRDEYFARTFKGLGHQMHLIQDAAQPDHVRNDAHPEDSLLENHYLIGSSYFETWAKSNPNKINSFASNPVFPQISLNINQSGKVPITQLIDTRQYYINKVPSASLTWGISEYTNSNFLSDDTIFTEKFSQNDGHYFPYPRYSTECYEIYEKDLPLNKKRTYFRKKCEGEKIERFVTVGPLFNLLSFNWDLQRLTLKLDEGAHYDYAQKLIPRAVGYSAGLLNYFFRGEMDMIPDEKEGSGYVIENNTDEDMSGQFELWYDNKDEERVKVSGASWTLNINKKSSGNNKSTNITFTPPDNAKEPGKYMLVFRGKLGNEEAAVVGKFIEEPKYLFLTGYNTNVFEIRITDNQYQLIPVNLTIPVGNSFSSTLLESQVDPGYSSHIITQSPSYIYSDDISGYGSTKCVQGICVPVGFRSFFRPSDFNTETDYILDKTFTNMFIHPRDLGYGTWGSGNDNDFRLLYTGRRPYELNSEGRLTKFAMGIGIKRKTDSDFYFVYMDNSSDRDYIDGKKYPKPEDGLTPWNQLSFSMKNGKSSSSGGFRYTLEPNLIEDVIYTPYTNQTPWGPVICYTRSTTLTYGDGFLSEPTASTSYDIPPSIIAILGDKPIYLVSEIETSGTSSPVSIWRETQKYNSKKTAYTGSTDYGCDDTFAGKTDGEVITDGIYISSNTNELWTKSIYIGETLLDSIQGSSFTSNSLSYNMIGEKRSGSVTSIQSRNDRNPATDYNNDSTSLEIFPQPFSSEQTSGNITIMEYDYLPDGNTYIILYKKITSSSYTSKTKEFDSYNWDMVTMDYSSSSSKKYEYYLHYKINDISKIIKLPYSWQETQNMGNVNRTGELVYYTTAKIDNDIMVYSFTVYSSPDSPEQVKPYDKNFKERIIGIINISNKEIDIGHKKEFKITRSGYPYHYYLDAIALSNAQNSLGAAIGVHRERNSR